MSHRLHLEAVNDMLRDIRNLDTLMGGVVVVLAGDFRQTLPIIKGGLTVDAVAACLKQSPLWQHVQKLRLTINVRAQLRNHPGDDSFHYGSLKLATVRLRQTLRHRRLLCLRTSVRVFPHVNSHREDIPNRTIDGEEYQQRMAL